MGVFTRVLPLVLISGEHARELARAFLERRYQVISVEPPVLADNKWLVEVVVSGRAASRMEVMINSKTGYIEGFSPGR